MEFPSDQIEELKTLFPDVQRSDEGGSAYFLLPSLQLPPGCVPEKVDALLCPMTRDGYPSRLFFSVQISAPVQRNWNANGVRILERNWHAFSWTIAANQRLAQMVGAHLKGLR
jgi:hypothetical protein